MKHLVYLAGGDSSYFRVDGSGWNLGFVLCQSVSTRVFCISTICDGGADIDRRSSIKNIDRTRYVCVLCVEFAGDDT